VLLRGHLPGLTILTCYFPVMKETARFFTRCTAIANAHSTTPFLLIGDLNTGNQDTDRAEGAARYHRADAFDGLTSRH